ncbi:MAG TPA: FtsX-like permease family protein [Solirubrobacterales bacterium]|nr:FtsX-like permease family protein [Solirubrobacterales bacterium]
MFGLALRGLASRKLRAALTGFAVMLGVAMVAGTFMLKGSVDKAFDDIFAEANAGIDVTVQPRSAFDTGFDLPESGAALSQSLVSEVEGVEGVEKAAGGINDSTSIAILDEDGDRIGPPGGGPPHIAGSVEPEPFNPFTWIEGSAPDSATEVGIDSITADEEGYEVGQKITVSGVRGAREYTLSGIGRFGSGIPLGGASFALFTLPEAQAITGKVGELDNIDVEAASGVSADELSARLNAALPNDAEAKTGAEDAAEQSADIKEGFSFLTTFLLVFAGISVFVGAFLIFNTFSITVAQRTREFGMLRTLGASSRQVLATVFGEALMLGIIASVIGIVAGLGFVALVTGAFKAMGFELPQSGIVVNGASIIVPLIVGIVSTLGSSIVPAIRATRVTPLEALRDDAQAAEKPSRRRVWIARGLVLVGIVAIAAGLFATASFSSALPLLGLGLILLFIGIAMLAGTLVTPLASLVGRPIERLRGVTGRLARENTLRNPSRTATTSAALMIGVALVVFAAVFAASATKSVGDALDETFAGDLIIANTDGFSPISPEIGREIAAVEGVETVSPLAGAPAEVELETTEQSLIAGLDPATLTDVAELDWVEGDDGTLTGLGPDQAIVESQWAEDHDVAVGDTVTLRTATGEEIEVEVAGSIRDRVQLLVTSLALPVDTLRRQFEVRQDFADLVGFAPGADSDAVGDRVDELLAKRFPQADARDQEQFKQEQEDGINQLLALIYVLLALSVIVSLFGVVNTLVLTIYERTREIGMLRAIGASRSQIRRMVRYESLITALIGALIGAVIGLGIAIAAVEALKDEGLVLAVPVVGIIVVLIVAGIAGIVAGIWPARRASKIEVMEALQYE